MLFLAYSFLLLAFLLFMMNVTDRFLKYVGYGTQSDPNTGLNPSTPGQMEFAHVLKEEMEAIGIQEVELDEFGYVMGVIPSTVERETPAIGFIAHMDTSPEMSGRHVNPRIIENYAGNDIVLNKEKGIVLSTEEFPELMNYVGQTLITTDGNTLLGADDKAGIAEILTAAEYLIGHPEVKHGKICICFTPDEEIGEGPDHFNVKKFGAKFAYTMDGGEIGEFRETLSGRDGIFGPSAFTDFIHNAQLTATGADVSFSTVLQMDALIEKGTVTIRDMFNLYSYENGLYIMAFTGKEIGQYLEYAYGLQYNTMTSDRDHLLRFKTDSAGKLIKNNRGKYVLATDFFNYSCAAGIKYTVDVTKPKGKRVEIHSMSDGSLFDENRTYQVAINSYRGNGGGGHLSMGLGWSKAEMEARVIKIMPKDVRYYLMEYILEKKVLNPQCRNDWKVIPAQWFKKGKERDYQLIYE